MSEWWRYENLEPCEEGKGWELGTAQSHPDDFTDFHIDLGCGKIPKARLGIDRNNGDICMDLNTGDFYESTGSPEELSLTNPKDGEHSRGKYGILPFPNNSIESIISHHFFEHLDNDGFINLLDDCYRVLVPGGILRIIVPLFPSRSAFESSDHKMFIGKETFIDYTNQGEGKDGEHWHEAFATPYTQARFEQTAIDVTPAPQIRGQVKDDVVHFMVDDLYVGTILDTDTVFNKPREMRVTLTK